jgi:hypothetical protein
MDVKAALRVLWADKATITEYEGYTRENKSTGQREIIVLKGEPCKLSFETLKPTNQTDPAATLVQVTKLFIDGKLAIKAGSKITVTRKSGEVLEFKQSGQAGLFTNHQEIPLMLFEGYA